MQQHAPSVAIMSPTASSPIAPSVQMSISPSLSQAMSANSVIPRAVPPRSASPGAVYPRAHSPHTAGRARPASRTMSPPASPTPPACSAADAVSSDTAPLTAEACFCTHNDVSCGHCNAAAIQGARYRCTSCAEVNLCEKCRRSGAHCADRHSYTVYDHPWEASEEYAGHAADAFRAPPAPLVLGDRGPRVMHLHFVLYTLGYLFLFSPGFRVDRFTSATREAVRRFQVDYAAHWGIQVEQTLGAYSVLTRTSILSRFEDILRMQINCRAEAAAAAGPRIRSALAA